MNFGGLPKKAKEFFVEESGGKRKLNVKRALYVGAPLFILLVVLSAFFSPKEDHTFYRRASQPPNVGATPESSPLKANKTDGLFANGVKEMSANRKAEADKKRRLVTIRYLAPQVVGMNTKGPKVMKVGSKLLGFLLSSIDTREPSLVRVLLPHGGEANGVEIQKNSILLGQYSYPGSGEKVFLNFNRMDDPDGNSIQISAQGYDATDYTAGIRAEVFTGKGVKIASQIGLTMFAGMADVLTERESLGFMSGSQTAKPTMKNAVLQGASRAAQDQASSSSQEIQSMKDYAVIREGKEVIIQLTEDWKR